MYRTWPSIACSSYKHTVPQYMLNFGWILNILSKKCYFKKGKKPDYYIVTTHSSTAVRYYFTQRHIKYGLSIQIMNNI